MKLHRFAASSIAIAVLAFASVGAQAVVVDISATSPYTVTQTLAAGTYDISWIDNTANGGYKGWSAYDYGNSTLWRETFSYSYGDVANATGATFTYDKAGTGHYVQYSPDADAALAAFQSGPYAFGVGSFSATQFTSTVSNATLTLATAGDVTFFLPDTFDMNAFGRADNTGGVSLSITAAVPEPDTYALMFAGLGIVGFVARRRSKKA